MGWDMPNEDDYWENVREDRERPKGECEYEKGRLYMDDTEDLAKIEEKRGWPIEDLSEEDLIEIVMEVLGISAESAEWNHKTMCIEYSYQSA